MEIVAVVLMVAVLCAPLLTSPQNIKRMVCPVTSLELMKSLPGGWRQGVGKFHTYMECEGYRNAAEEIDDPKMPKVILRSESYLNGLDAPVSYFKIDLVRKEEKMKAGFGVTQKVDYLEVEKISPEGMLPSWNKAHPMKALKLKDRIINVNGVESNASTMASELRVGGDISLRVVRIGQYDVDNAEKKKFEKGIKKIIKTKPPMGLGMGIPEPGDSKVAVLHSNNVMKFIEAVPLCLVMFYANWCGHCKEVAPGFTEASKMLHNAKLPVYTRIAKFDDGDRAHQPFNTGSPDKFNYTSFPTMIVFEKGKEKTRVAVDGAEEIAGIMTAIAQDKDIEKEMEKVMLKMRPMLYRPVVGSEVVYDLEPETFDDVVLREYEGNNAVWIIEFYSDKCPFCRSLKPEVIKASEECKRRFGDKVRIGAVNSRAFRDLPKRFGVTSYPWIISIYANRKIEDMAGLGGSESIINWAREMKDQNWKSKPVWGTEAILVPDESQDKMTPGENPAQDQTFNNTGSWRELLGRRTWFFLHTFAAKYPDKPTEQDKVGARHLVTGLGQHYPCPLCRSHLQAKLANDMPPLPVDKREDLAVWFCNLHNLVNEDLGKAKQSCSPFTLDLMYLKSCGECSADPSKAGGGYEKVEEWDPQAYFKGLLPVGHTPKVEEVYQIDEP
mmetsp:Transcript_136587/g.248396  ORF Transcript_136587/g.248396 Transcript_136587/m.248396 type:complete len:666 (+) Transcript_136587:96-2093(+)